MRRWGRRGAELARHIYTHLITRKRDIQLVNATSQDTTWGTGSCGRGDGYCKWFFRRFYRQNCFKLELLLLEKSLARTLSPRGRAIAYEDKRLQRAYPSPLWGLGKLCLPMGGWPKARRVGVTTMEAVFVATPHPGLRSGRCYASPPLGRPSREKGEPLGLGQAYPRAQLGVSALGAFGVRVTS